MTNVVSEKIGDGIEVLIEGLPKSQLTAATQAQAALALVKHGIPIAGAFSVGIIGDISQAILKINGQLFHLKYALKAQRAITLVEVYSEAIQWIAFQVSRGAFDKEMANEVTATLRELSRIEQRRWLRE